jgi:hypothetical protein
MCHPGQSYPLLYFGAGQYKHEAPGNAGNARSYYELSLGF